MTFTKERPRVCSVAGTDSGGGAGLCADQRAAEAFGIHLCPVVAAITAQNSVAVQHLEAMTPALLEAQLRALADDLPPAVVKTGLLGSVANVQVLARWIDEQRQHRPLPLVVDPVLRASTGAALANAELIAAYRQYLLPRATLITPNRREAAALLGIPEATTEEVPAQASALRALGPRAVLITGGDAADTLALDWLDSVQAQGWLSLPREPARHTHGTGCTLATAAASALAHGFTEADAAVLAKMLTTHALRHGQPQGAGAGPVHAGAGWSLDPTVLPHLTPGSTPPRSWPGLASSQGPATREATPADARAERPATPRASTQGLYGIVGSADHALTLLGVGTPLRHLQLRVKAPAAGFTAAGTAALEAEIRRCRPAALASGTTLWVNDHWQVALAAGAPAVHLGQEDLLALRPSDREALAQARQTRGLLLGVSSHTVWELARAAAWQPDLIACGPIWPTITKDMPWRPQGLDNLAWWSAVAPAPVVAVGGVLELQQVEAVARTGAAAVCLVRALTPGLSLAPWQEAWESGLAEAPVPVPPWPHPCL